MGGWLTWWGVGGPVAGRWMDARGRAAAPAELRTKHLSTAFIVTPLHSPSVIERLTQLPRAAGLPAACPQILAPAKTVIENVGGSLDLKERESHLTAWGVKKASAAPAAPVGSQPAGWEGRGGALLFVTPLWLPGGGGGAVGSGHGSTPLPPCNTHTVCV